jgi:hypothetical protein
LDGQIRLFVRRFQRVKQVLYFPLVKRQVGAWKRALLGPFSLSCDQLIEKTKLRFAAEQQCVLREQHITARMWMEKAQAEERAEQSERRIQELERNVKAWEAWHQSQRKQARARRQQALRAAPDELMRMILGELGVQSIQALKPEERHHLAAGLATAVSALLVGKPPPPPGLMRPPPADP